jgi:hypothetical protein
MESISLQLLSCTLADFSNPVLAVLSAAAALFQLAAELSAIVGHQGQIIASRNRVHLG